MNLIGDVLKLVSKLPPEGLAVLGRLVKALLSSPDPMRAVKRAALAAASEQASDAAIRKALEKRT